LGSGAYSHPSPQVAHVRENVASYRAFYPLLRESVASASGHLTDLSDLFDHVEDEVFADDCHLNPAFQPMVAEAVLQALVERGILPAVSGRPMGLTP
jgi:hypothetical protein